MIHSDIRDRPQRTSMLTGKAKVFSHKSKSGYQKIVGNLWMISVLWQREMIRVTRSWFNFVMGLVAPLLYLVILGTGIGSAVYQGSNGSGDYRSYLFPGILLMAAQAPAFTVGAGIVWDRESGLLRQMLVAPVSRSAILTGICLGGASTGIAYAVPLMAIGGLVGVPYRPVLLLALAELALLAFAFTAIGLVLAVCIKRAQTFQAVAGFCMAPLLFISGALFPTSGLPGWLSGVVLANPLTYGVDALRRALPGPLDLGGRAHGPRWGDWAPPEILEVGIVAILALVALLVATRRFAVSE
jgi:ABC-2 type transport system permease protein